MKYKTDAWSVTQDQYIEMTQWCKQQFAEHTWHFEYIFYGSGYFEFENLNDLTWFNLRWK